MVNSLKKKINAVRTEFDSAAQSVQNDADLENLRIVYLGRKGKITELFKSMGTLPETERRSAGQAINALKAHVQSNLTDQREVATATSKKESLFDVTLPGHPVLLGKHHPITTVLRQITSCFKSLGFTVAQGPEVETDYYNFEALNLPKGHPARDMQDTLYVDEDVVLRTHTSPVQVRVMEDQPPPVRIIAPGRCYRRDTPDATHSPVFHQVEGLCVDEGVTFSDLKGVILTFARSMFGSDMKIRFRPSFFPFTEPSAEYDFSCLMCRGAGCKICKGTGWIEISGAGMVNPAVYDYVNYDAEKYTGYAFGMGVERVAMLMYEVNDIRLFYENDVRFLSQF